jgi:hypothetical protein
MPPINSTFDRLPIIPHEHIDANVECAVAEIVSCGFGASLIGASS